MPGKRRRIRAQVRKAERGIERNTKYLASCYGKVRRTKEEAHREADNRPDIVKAYKCKFCEYYHIGRRK